MSEQEIETPEMKKIKDLLNQLVEYKSQQMLINVHKDEAIEKAIPAPIKKVIDEITQEFSVQEKAVAENISSLESQIKTLALQVGETVNGDFLRATYMPGRVTWDTARLEGMAKLIKEIETCKKVGEPYISIVAKKG